jgi:energy-coupling factor transporter ATP-binding protein EcfA2
LYFSINGGNAAFGADVILNDIHFEIRDKQKIAVVGRNGCGKSTLLKVISGELELENVPDIQGISKSENDFSYNYIYSIAIACTKDEPMRINSIRFSNDKKLEQKFAGVSLPREDQISDYFDNISFTLNGEELIVNGDLDGDGWRGKTPVGLWTKEYRRKHVYAGFADGLAGAE